MSSNPSPKTSGTAPGSGRPPAAHGRGLPPPIDHLLLRVVALSLVLGLAHFWAVRHLDFALLEKLPEATLFSVLLPYSIALLNYFGEKRELKRLTRMIRRYGAVILSNGLLLTVGPLLVLTGSAVSSVRIVPPPDGPEVSVVLRPADHSRADPEPPAVPLNPGETRRLLRWTSPLGRTYVLAAEGYQPLTFDLYPWVGRRLEMERDLAPAPSVLVRVPLARLAQLPGGRLELWTVEDHPRKLGETPTAEGQGAALFGREVPLDSRLLVEWEHELRVAGAEARALSSVYLSWKHPIHVPLRPALTPGTRLEARFIPRGGGVQASSRVTVTTAPLLDVPLRPVSP